MIKVASNRQKISEYVPFIESTPKTALAQVIDAQNTGQNCNFIFNSPSARALLDATQVYLVLKVRVTFNEAIPGFATDVIGIRHNAVMNAISSATLSLNGSSRTFNPTQISNLIEEWQTPNWAYSKNNGGPTQIRDNSGVGNKHYDRQGQYRDRVHTLSRQMTETAGTYFDLEIVGRVNMGVFWNGFRSELSAQFSNCIPHANKLSLNISWLPKDGALEASIFEFSRESKVLAGDAAAKKVQCLWKGGNTVACSFENKSQLYVNWYEPADDQIIPPIVRIPTYSCTVDTTPEQTVAAASGSKTAYNSAYLRINSVPKFICFYGELNRNNTNDNEGYKLFGTDTFPDLEVQNDANPQITDVNISIGNSYGIVNTQITNRQIYNWSMANSPSGAAHYNYITYQLYRCKAILNIDQLSNSSGVPSQVISSGSNIKVSCNLNSPTKTNSYGYQEKDKKYVFRTVIINNSEYLEITENSASYQKQNINANVAKQVGSGIRVGGSIQSGGTAYRCRF